MRDRRRGGLTEPLKLVYALSALGEGRRRELAKLKALQREGDYT